MYPLSAGSLLLLYLSLVPNSSGTSSVENYYWKKRLIGSGADFGYMSENQTLTVTSVPPSIEANLRSTVLHRC